MLYYLIIERKDYKPLDEDIMGIFDDFLVYTKLTIDQHRAILWYEVAVEHSFQEIILNIMSETFTDLRLYASHAFTHDKEREEHFININILLNQIPFTKYYYIDDKIIVRHFLNDLTPQIKKLMLRRFYNDPVMMETIDAYLSCDLNMVNAAKKLYVHRNTLIQRLDKLYQTTGFDIRNFNDALLMYHLIQ